MAFNRYTARNVGAALTDVKTFSATTTIIGISVANRTAADIKVAVALYDGTASTYIVGGPTVSTMGATVPAGGALVVCGGDQKIVALNLDKLQVEASAANGADVILSVLE